MKILILTLFATISWSYDCNVHKIYCKVVKTKPNINKAYAKRLSDLLYKHSETPMISVAISMQENLLRFSHRYERVYVDGKTIQGVSDFGPFQIHIDTAKRYNLDLKKLDTDLEYNVIWHSKILKEKIRICKKLGKKAFSCYHSFTPELREAYYRKVMRFM